MAKEESSSGTMANLFMLAIGLVVAVAIYKKYKDWECKKHPEKCDAKKVPEDIGTGKKANFPLPYTGKLLNEFERVGSEDPTIQRRRIIAVNNVAGIVTDISAYPVDPIKVRDDLDRMGRQKDHSSCESETIYDILVTLVFSTNMDPYSGNNLAQFDSLSHTGAKAYLLWAGLPPKHPIQLAGVCGEPPGNTFRGNRVRRVFR